MTHGLCLRRISTPVGEFRISRIGETTISINEERPDLILSGSLDRLSGKLTILGQHPAEAAKVTGGIVRCTCDINRTSLFGPQAPI